MKIDKEILKGAEDRLIKSPLFIEDCDHMVKDMLAICAISGADIDDIFNKTVITMKAIIEVMDDSGRTEVMINEGKNIIDQINKELGIEFE